MFNADRIASIVTVAVVAVFVALLYLSERSRFVSDTMVMSNWIALGAASVVFVLPLFPTIAIPIFPQVWRQERRSRRWKRGQCPDCTHPFDAAQATCCTECGTALNIAPPPFEFRFMLLRQFAVLLLVAWVLGVAAGECHARLDEYAFGQKIQQERARGLAPKTRPRWWPATDRSFVPTREHRFIVN